jgi:hypothetical protein
MTTVANNLFTDMIKLAKEAGQSSKNMRHSREQMKLYTGIFDAAHKESHSHMYAKRVHKNMVFDGKMPIDGKEHPTETVITGAATVVVTAPRRSRKAA